MKTQLGGCGRALFGLCLFTAAFQLPAQTQSAVNVPSLQDKQPKAPDADAQARMQNSVSVAYLQGKAVVAPDAVAQIGPDLFGDKVNLYNGPRYRAEPDGRVGV